MGVRLCPPSVRQRSVYLAAPPRQILTGGVEPPTEFAPFYEALTAFATSPPAYKYNDADPNAPQGLGSNTTLPVGSAY
jgi:hypothetical protein